jgi:hypothetical protein
MIPFLYDCASGIQQCWVVLPAELLMTYGLEPVTTVLFVDYGGVLAIIPAMREPVKETAGMLAGGKN